MDLEKLKQDLLQKAKGTGYVLLSDITAECDPDSEEYDEIEQFLNEKGIDITSEDVKDMDIPLDADALDVDFDDDIDIDQLDDLDNEFIEDLSLDNLEDESNDNSTELEFPDYICREIINELISLVMANQADERLAVYP